ncbi:L,D-transpeptidase [Paenibacillus nasutitermitis]|uniref:L,D-TPase catalytic domain-containing protein n=1 Tax=Paenibacillus nasutitermitis TaxID=1652958 RepID=A0A916YR06_9BACL|nr:L,D-transpeptidase [Paenibacillus nasutitermitis]GGD55198.1 hypothetical protein GCM10010911_11090 [Paenibacillus nasutitermitis]
MEQQDDMSYLKRYVQNHPDNRMAWYLLGKQYVNEDKQAKANYCFLKSGSIYEAFERKQHPLASEPQQLIAQWNRRRRMKLLALRSTIALLLLIGAVLTDPFRGDHSNNSNLTGEQATEAAGEPVGEDKGTARDVRVVFVKPTDPNGVGKAMGALMRNGKQSADLGLAAMLEEEGSWRKWMGNTRMLLSAKRQGSGQAYNVGMLDAKTCDCQPSDAAGARKAYSSWSKQQEQRWTLSSTVAQYRNLFNRWPDKIDDMVRPYPNNILSGETQAMRMMFTEVLQKLKASEGLSSGAAAGGSDRTASGKNASTSPVEELSLPDKPLSIIIDQERHKLAVVSGDVIVRSYNVGLGGEKTPSGSFTISEKVKNPNGRDDGEFGSRGMTLSATRYAIHGTDEPGSIGKDESHGCVRMGKADVEELFDLVPLGTKVEIGSGQLPASPSKPADERFRLQPMQDETNPDVVYRWLN